MRSAECGIRNNKQGPARRIRTRRGPFHTVSYLILYSYKERRLNEETVGASQLPGTETIELFQNGSFLIPHSEFRIPHSYHSALRIPHSDKSGFVRVRVS